MGRADAEVLAGGAGTRYGCGGRCRGWHERRDGFPARRGGWGGCAGGSVATAGQPRLGEATILATKLEASMRTHGIRPREGDKGLPAPLTTTSYYALRYSSIVIIFLDQIGTTNEEEGKDIGGEGRAGRFGRIYRIVTYGTYNNATVAPILIIYK